MPKQYLPLLGQPIALYRYYHLVKYSGVSYVISSELINWAFNGLQFLYILWNEWSEGNSCSMWFILQGCIWRSNILMFSISFLCLWNHIPSLKFCLLH